MKKRIKWDADRVPKPQGWRNGKFIAITKGNIKLGQTVWKFSLPVSPQACPGATQWCSRHCYAREGWYVRKLIKNIRDENWRLAQDTAAFVTALTHDLARAWPRASGACHFRIHDSGDFFSIPYIRAWHQIIVAHPQVKFWAFTHSWTQPHLLDALNELRALPNLQLFASLDPETPPPPVGWRIAAMSGIVEGVICLFQTQHKANCAECGFCFKPSSRNVIWLYHGKKENALTQQTMQFENI